MKEQIVTFEVAKLAEEHGFDWVCRSWYENCENNNWFEPISPGNYNDRETFSDTISSPTQELLKRWFREVKDINIDVYTSYDTETHEETYRFYTHRTSLEKINQMLDELEEDELIKFDEYEDALEEALKEGFNLLKEK